MNWGDEMPHPAAILVFIAILFPLAWLYERRDRKRAEREADELRQLALEHEQEIAEMQAELIEHDWVDAMIENAFRVELKRQQTAMERIYRDAGIPMPPNPWAFEGPVGGFKNVVTPRVTDCQIAPHGILEPGLCVKAHCEAEAAEVVAQSSKFGARAA